MTFLAERIEVSLQTPLALDTDPFTTPTEAPPAEDVPASLLASNNAPAAAELLSAVASDFEETLQGEVQEPGAVVEVEVEVEMSFEIVEGEVEEETRQPDEVRWDAGAAARYRR